MSFTDSNADTTKMQPAAASSGHSSAWRSTCSTFTVQSNVRCGKRSCIARTTRIGVLRCVEEVGIPERDVCRPGGDELLDVGEHRGLVGDTDPAVVDDRNRAVPTPVRAPAARFDRTDDARGLAVDQVRVAVEAGEQVTRRQRGARCRGVAPELDRGRVVPCSTQSTSATSYSPAITTSATSSHMPAYRP